MRESNLWVIVTSVKGEACDLNKMLKENIFQKFNARGSKLPPHFTIKAPFEADDISNAINAIEKFSQKASKGKYIIDGFNHFSNRVVFMDVKMLEEAKAVHDALIDELLKVGITFDKKDGKNKKFHVTIVSKNVQTNFECIWEYVLEFKCYFELYFDNVEIYKFQNNRWMLFKSFQLKEV